MEAPKYGKEVSLSEARKYVETYKPLRDTLIEEILKAPDTATDPVKNSITFHKSEVNAFIFDAALITRFFEGEDPADYLMVFLGADGVKPTVVAAGVKAGSKPGTFNSLISSKPGSQHPGVRVDANFPGPGSGGDGTLCIDLKYV